MKMLDQGVHGPRFKFFLKLTIKTLNQIFRIYVKHNIY